MTYCITATFDRPTYQSHFNYTSEGLRDVIHDCEYFETESAARSAFDAVDASGFVWDGSLKVYLYKFTENYEQAEIIAEKTIDVAEYREKGV